jgi:hypothetical protein
MKSAATTFLLLAVLVAGCERPTTPPDVAVQTVEKNVRMLFTRLKLADKAVLWENEYPYLHEDMEFENYLQNPYIAQYRTDTLMAMQIDSITMGDSLVSGHRNAIAYLEMEYLLADSSFSVNKIRMPWVEVDGKWIKPNASSMDKQVQFEEDVRMYWEAVREKERGETPASSDGSGQ